MTEVKQKNRVAIMIKGPLQIAAIAMDTNVPASDSSQLNIVGSTDPRCHAVPRYMRAFQTTAEAEKAFHDALATSRDRGWSVAYNGQRNGG